MRADAWWQSTARSRGCDRISLQRAWEEGRSSRKITAQGQFTWYVYEPNSHRPLVMIKQGQVYHYHLDHIGTPIRLSDEQGNIV